MSINNGKHSFLLRFPFLYNDVIYKQAKGKRIHAELAIKLWEGVFSMNRLNLISLGVRDTNRSLRFIGVD